MKSGKSELGPESLTFIQPAPPGPHCPKCGRAYVGWYIKPHGQKTTYVCIGYAHGGGCGHEWEKK